MGQCEKRTWQIVLIQMHLRIKAIGVIEATAQSIEVKEEVGDHCVEADEIGLENNEPEVGYTNMNNYTCTFNCTHCERTFNSKKGMMHHMSSHPEIKKPFTCLNCEKSFANTCSLAKHRHLHSNQRTFECKLCGAATSAAHCGWRPLCRRLSNVCGQQFKHNQMLQHHFTEYHAGAGPIACPDCDKTFESTKHLARHKRCMYSGARERTYVCDICQKRFHELRTLRRHIQRHIAGRIECTICGKSLKSIRFMEKHMRLHETNTAPKPLSCMCDECGKGFRSRFELKQHMLVDSGERSHEFHQCDYMAAKLSSLKAHLATHSTARPFQCTEYSRAFVTKDSLHKHRRYRPTKVRPFQCNFCPKQFAFNGQQQEHMLTHTGVKPHNCNESSAPVVNAKCTFGRCTLASGHSNATPATMHFC